MISSTPPPYDRPLSTYLVNQTAEMVGFYYLEDELERWAELAMDASQTNGKIAVPGSLNVVVQSIDYISENNTQITIHATRQMIPAFDPEAITFALRGLKPGEAADLIRDTLIPGSQPVIMLNLAWWGRLPFIPMRITVDG